MATNDKLVLTWRKRDNESPWLIKWQDDDGSITETSVGSGGITAAGPRLQTLLLQMEAQIKHYPLVYRMEHIKERQDRQIKVQHLNEKPTFAEATEGLVGGVNATFRPMPYKPTEDEASVLSSEQARAFKQPWGLRTASIMSTQNTEGVTVKEEQANTDNRYWIFMHNSSVNAKDGGSLSGYIEGFYWPNDEEVPSSIGDQILNIQQMTIDVDYLGVAAFAPNVSENKEKAIHYHLTPEVLRAVGLEARNYNRKLIEDNALIAISLQYNTSTGRVIPSSSGALLGSVYVTSYSSFDEIESAIVSGSFKGINLNKSLLKEHYSYAERIKDQYPTSPHLPLVEYNGHRDARPTDGLKTSGWAREYSLEEPPNEQTYLEKKQAIENQANTTEENLKDVFERVVEGIEKDESIGREEIKARDFVNNDLAFVPAKDDRMEAGELYSSVKPVDDEDDISEDLPYDYIHRVRIGDSIFEVPPLSIQVDKEHRNEKVQAMRTKTALQKQIGYTQNIITLELYFHDLENINGRKVHAYTKQNGEQVFYYMDGLRSLLAQFKKTPFLPIDNDYINSSLNVANVALVSVSAQTVEGFPEALQATVVLEEIDVKALMMGKETLGEVMNYPLMRWYYQQALQEPSIYQPQKTYLPPIDHLDNHFSFRVVNRQALEQRAELIHEFRQMKVPARMKEELQDVERNEDAYKMFDSGYAKDALEQYNKFMQAYANGVQKDNVSIPAGGLKESYPVMNRVTILPHTYFDEWGEGWLREAHGIDKVDYGKELAKHLYGVYEPNINLSKHPSPFLKRGAEAAFYTLNTAVSSTLIADSYLSGTNKPKSMLKQVIEENNLPGFFMLRVRDDDNVRSILALDREYQDATGSFLYSKRVSNSDNGAKDFVFLLPAGTVAGIDFMATIKRMSEQSDSVNDEMEEYTFNYNAMAAEINKTEENMPMDDYDINNLIPLSLNVSLHNNFSSVQPQAAEVPTKQFLGAQEPQVVVSFETDDSGVNRVDTLMRTVAEYAKQYREGLVSGFIDITNPLINLFGITSVLPETVQFSTVPGNPERKIVTLGFIAFDKSQRRQEALYGFRGAPNSPELRELAFGNKNYDPNVTPLYTHEKLRHMELYPDLELPTIEKLNEELAFIDAGFSKWENRTDQIYLDPDFYISTNGTYRKYIKDVLDSENGPSFRWEDETGLVAETNLKDGRPLVMSEEDMKEFEKQFNETEYIDPIVKWEGFEDNGIEEFLDGKEGPKQDVKISSNLATPPESYSNSTVESYAKGGEWKKKPSFEEWNRMTQGGTRDEYDKLMKGEGPTEAEIWLHLANTIRKHYADVDLHFAPGEEKVLGGGEPEGLSLSSHYSTKLNVDFGNMDVGARTWANPLEYYWLDYAYQGRTLDASEKDLKNGNEEELRKSMGKDGKMARLFDSISIVNKDMPFMRVMTYMKSILTVESMWRVLDENEQPVVSQRRQDGAPWRVGLMGANLDKVNTLREAERLMWDWKYNIEHAVRHTANIYKQAEKSDYREIRIRRLDWAIASHSGAEMPPILESNDKKDDKPFGETNESISPDYFAYFGRVNSQFMRDAMRADTEAGQGIYLNAYGAYIPEIFNLYNQNEDGLIGYQTPEEEMESQKANAGRNTLTWTAEEKVKGMYIDMYHHDQTGRFLRAFPSFSLQLIDEGKWYRNFRTWDNFYGYNSLNSIDVYKSRKIAADTAVIEMSNMYGGLTGMRHDMKHFDFRMPSFFSAQFWTHYVWGSPTDEILDERAEIYETIMLQPGARIQLRMGYGSDVHSLPIMFNGVITEVDADEVVVIQAQSDALELTNSIGGSPKDDNKRYFQITEPSEYIGRLMTTKGNWIRDIINDASDGTFFKESPMGIAHFGASTEATKGNWLPFQNETYEEPLQNVYAQSSIPDSPAQRHGWARPDGTEISWFTRAVDRVAESVPTQPFRSDYDEDNIAIPVYGMTVWEIVQTFALCSMDFVAQVLPFEYRSTLYFGRPHWQMTYAYDSEFVYDQATEQIRREITHKHEKTFMQAHIYSSQYNILHNNIRTSEEGVYNNVIVSYDGHTVGPMQADNDIRFDRQRTATVEAQIMARGGGPLGWFGTEYHTSEKQAQTYGMSTVRDYMKDMYKGTYTVIGDPSVKPYDINYLGDTVLDMQGIHLVKAVHHSMSVETGYITHIEPDAYVVNFDQELLFMADKIFTVGKNTISRAVGMSLGASALSFVIGAPVLSKLYAGFMGAKTTQAVIGSANTIRDGVTRRIISRSYEKIALSVGSEKFAAQAVALRHAKDKATADAIINSFGAFKSDVLSQAAITHKSNMFQLNMGAKWAKAEAAGAAKKITIGTQTWNKSALYTSFAGDIDAVNNIASLYRKKQTADIYGAMKATVGTAIEKVSVTTKLVLSSPLFWTVAITTVLNIATSSLVEAWTRRKQNAECIKVIPLSYKGRPMTAAMNGRRGSVVGDNPSLADDLYNARFGETDGEAGKVWWRFVPQMLNWLEGS